MTTRAEIVAEARTWLGTPFHHQGRLKGVGADCPAPIIGVNSVFNLCPDFVDTRDYARVPDGRIVLLLKRHLIPVSFADRLPADIVCMAWGREPQHIGILTGRDIVLHAYSGSGGRGKVVETTLAGRHLDRIRGVFRFPGVSD